MPTEKIHLTEKEQASLDRGIRSYLRSMEGDFHIALDLETNGLRAGMEPVLSMSAEKFVIGQDKRIVIADSFTRYYYCTEPYNPGATRVNHLYDDTVITERRSKDKWKGKYPKHFLDDLDFVKKFCGSCKNYMGHNIINYDSKWLTSTLDMKNMFDTQRANAWFPPSHNNGMGPRLPMAVDYYKITLDESQLHTSSYDVEMVRRVFEKMLELSTMRVKKMEEVVF